MSQRRSWGTSTSPTSPMRRSRISRAPPWRRRWIGICRPLKTSWLGSPTALVPTTSAPAVPKERARLPAKYQARMWWAASRRSNYKTRTSHKRPHHPIQMKQCSKHQTCRTSSKVSQQLGAWVPLCENSNSITLRRTWFESLNNVTVCAEIGAKQQGKVLKNEPRGKLQNFAKMTSGDQANDISGIGNITVNSTSKAKRKLLTSK